MVQCFKARSIFPDNNLWLQGVSSHCLFFVKWILAFFKSPLHNVYAFSRTFLSFDLSVNYVRYEKSGARASGGVGVISRMPGEGDVTALPLFRQGAGDSSLLSDSSPVLVVLYNKVFLVCV
jgi:hypothetical protein